VSLGAAKGKHASSGLCVSFWTAAGRLSSNPHFDSPTHSGLMVQQMAGCNRPGGWYPWVASTRAAQVRCARQVCSLSQARVWL